jgi:ElaB/YqjD/DUF883 family membrane-anchored ribosome-binding protein
MDERRLESMTESAQRGTRRLASEVENLTGQPLESWMRDLRGYVQDHPLQAIAVTIGLGFVLGKILGRD